MLSNIICNIRNGQMAYLLKVSVKETKYCSQILNILWCENFIRGYSKGKNGTLFILLRYFKGRPAFHRLVIISKRSRKCTVSWLDLIHYQKNFGVFILSTPKGIITSDIAIKKKVGGQVLAYFE